MNDIVYRGCKSRLELLRKFIQNVEYGLPSEEEESNYDAVSANVMIWVLQMGESENGQMVSEKSEISIIWCISATNNVKSCTIFKETVQTANFTVFTMCGKELPVEKTYLWWKLKKRKRIFLTVFHQYDLNRVYHEIADVLRIPKML